MPGIRIFQDTAEGAGGRAALAAFFRALRELGEDVELVAGSDVYHPCDIAIVFGAPKPGDGVKEYRRRLHAEHAGVFVVLDSAIVGRSVFLQRPPWWQPHRRLRRKNNTLTVQTDHYRVGLNGAFHNTGDFCNAGSPPDRWEALSRDKGLRLEPYRDGGRHILLVGQIPSDASLQGADIIAWMEDTLQALLQRTKRRIVVRPHPGTRNKDLKRIAERIAGSRQVKLDMPPRGTVQRALAKAALCVTYSSSTAIDALLMGVPAIAMSPASLAWPVAGHDLERLDDPVRPPREQWLWDLAYAQWTEAEIASGEVWRRLRERALHYLQAPGRTV